MNRCAAVLLAAGTLCGARSSSAQSPETRLPRTASAVAEWDAAIVRRAAELIGSPAQWNRSDAAQCSAAAKTFSIRCALEWAIASATGRIPRKVPPATLASPVECRLTPANGRSEGSCGVFFDEATVFVVAPAKAITTGIWRSDSTPTQVWSGQMINSESPVMDLARKQVELSVPGKFRNSRLARFNDDTTITFETLQSYFRSLEEHVRALTAADLNSAADSVEIELYGNAGVIRTYNGWYAVRAFSADASGLRFQVDTSSELAPNTLDRQILIRADALLSSDAVWNRKDNRKCDPAATTLSIYCAMERATREVTGGFHHRRPALEIVRVIIEERTKGRNYDHRLMDYNNDATTHLEDVRSLFVEALKRSHSS